MSFLGLTLLVKVLFVQKYGKSVVKVVYADILRDLLIKMQLSNQNISRILKLSYPFLKYLKITRKNLNKSTQMAFSLTHFEFLLKKPFLNHKKWILETALGFCFWFFNFIADFFIFSLGYFELIRNIDPIINYVDFYVRNISYQVNIS